MAQFLRSWIIVSFPEPFHALKNLGKDCNVFMARGKAFCHFLNKYKVDPESVRFRFRYFSQILIWTPVTSKSPVSSIKYQDENNNR